MSKQKTIKYLTDLMATVQMAHFKGRMTRCPLIVHEEKDYTAAICIDLYHFGGDGKPVCEGLTFRLADADAIQGVITPFAICYDPDDEKHPLTLTCTVEGDDDAFDITPAYLPTVVLERIAKWLEAEMQKKTPEKERNDVTSFFYYMWNAWCEEECQKAFSAPGNNWKHFWNKWCGICKAHSVYGAAERFYGELSNRNRNLLVKRATEVYEGDSEKQ